VNQSNPGPSTVNVHTANNLIPPQVIILLVYSHILDP
jgi:hypothetical protein